MGGGGALIMGLLWRATLQVLIYSPITPWSVEAVHNSAY